MHRFFWMGIALSAGFLTACDKSSSSGSSFVSVSNGFVNTSRISRDPDGTTTFASSFGVNTVNNVINRTSIDADGNVDTTGIATYNSRGYLTRNETFASDGSLLSVDTYTHNTDGYLIGRRSENLGETRTVTLLTLAFDAQNRIATRDIVSSPSGEMLSSFTYFYDSRGLVSTATATFFDAGVQSAQDSYSYSHDTADRLVARDTDFGSDGSVDRREQLVYDSFGNVVLQTFSDDTGATTSTTTYEYERVNEPVYNLWVRIFRYFP